MLDKDYIHNNAEWYGSYTPTDFDDAMRGLVEYLDENLPDDTKKGAVLQIQKVVGVVDHYAEGEQ
ncbi:hypothetical protein CHCC5027_3543 [Bacillus paralicheniformis]|uniref:hypothetical protein n=1 Tax=Bacillus paralicheniformis TaxID=1648923 RepID=UPI0011A75B23|nr:hypothetical protein [Bacillus paralicheniformis]TWJ39630.1 hypothetical protein CHCC5027_3543 [Bacillus paralicheniformis]